MQTIIFWDKEYLDYQVFTKMLKTWIFWAKGWVGEIETILTLQKIPQPEGFGQQYSVQISGLHIP